MSRQCRQRFNHGRAELDDEVIRVFAVSHDSLSLEAWSCISEATIAGLIALRNPIRECSEHSQGSRDGFQILSTELRLNHSNFHRPITLNQPLLSSIVGHSFGISLTRSRCALPQLRSASASLSTAETVKREQTCITLTVVNTN